MLGELGKHVDALKLAPLRGAEIDGTAKECPSIGALQKSMTILLAVIIISFIRIFRTVKNSDIMKVVRIIKVVRVVKSIKIVRAAENVPSISAPPDVPISGMYIHRGSTPKIKHFNLPLNPVSIILGQSPHSQPDHSIPIFLEPCRINSHPARLSCDGKGPALSPKSISKLDTLRDSVPVIGSFGSAHPSNKLPDRHVRGNHSFPIIELPMREPRLCTLVEEVNHRIVLGKDVPKAKRRLNVYSSAV